MKRILIPIGVIVAIVAGYALFAINNTEKDLNTKESLEGAIVSQDENLLTFIVGPRKMECTGAGSMECLIVNDKYFYDTIEGFNFEEGYKYQLLVERTEREDVPADASKYTYRLIKEVSKTLQSSDVSLEGTSWVFGENGMLSFNEGRYSATVGCNIINGAFTENGNSIRFEAGMSTLMACLDLEEAENHLKEVLSKATEYKLAGEKLTLTGEGVSLELSLMKDAVLTGTEWNISSIKEGAGITSSAVDKGTFLIFNTDGTFSGKSACNSIMGSYTMAGEKISTSNIGSTKMLCSDEENTREQVLINSLSNISEYKIAGNMLTLVSTDGEYKIELSNK